jgi:hypothetical protein
MNPCAHIKEPPGLLADITKKNFTSTLLNSKTPINHEEVKQQVTLSAAPWSLRILQDIITDLLFLFVGNLDVEDFQGLHCHPLPSPCAKELWG